MGDGGGYETQLEALKEHAKEVHAIGDHLGTVCDAASQDLGSLFKAFGILGTVFGGFIAEGFVLAADGAISGTSAAAYYVEDLVKQAEQAYRDLEDHNAKAFKKHLSELKEAGRG